MGVKENKIHQKIVPTEDAPTDDVPTENLSEDAELIGFQESISRLLSAFIKEVRLVGGMSKNGVTDGDTLRFLVSFTTVCLSTISKNSEEFTEAHRFFSKIIANEEYVSVAGRVYFE